MKKTAFFGRIPEHAFTLRAARALKSRDLELLGLVMTYAATGREVVEARQRTLARRLCCSVRTVQRSLSRLADQGFLTKQYRRDDKGRLLGLSYDVAPTLAMMPRARSADATKTPGGESTRNGASASRDVSLPTRQNCPSPNEMGVAERDNTAPPGSQTLPPSPVVAELIALGVHRRVAATLADRFGDARCRQVLTALTRRAKIRDRAAWCVGCLLENWDLTPAPTAAPPPAARPQAQRPYCPPAALPVGGDGGKPDPLDDLAAGDLLRLEGTARRQLIAEMPVLRASFERGRSLALVHARMRELLTAPDSPPAPNNGGGGEEASLLAPPLLGAGGASSGTNEADREESGGLP